MYILYTHTHKLSLSLSLSLPPPLSLSLSLSFSLCVFVCVYPSIHLSIMRRVGHIHIYTVYAQYFWQKVHQI